jgi:hypothetical protein
MGPEHTARPSIAQRMFSCRVPRCAQTPSRPNNGRPAQPDIAIKAACRKIDLGTEAKFGSMDIVAASFDEFAEGRTLHRQHPLWQVMMLWR